MDALENNTKKLFNENSKNLISFELYKQMLKSYLIFNILDFDS